MSCLRELTTVCTSASSRMETAGFRMEEEFDEDAEDEMDEEEMEAMLYSQVHFARDDDNDQGMDKIYNTSFGAQHTFSVTSFEEHRSGMTWEESGVNSASGRFTSLGDTESLSSTKRLVSSGSGGWFDEPMGSKPLKDTSDLLPRSALVTSELDNDRLTQHSPHANDYVITCSLKKTKSKTMGKTKKDNKTNEKSEVPFQSQSQSTEVVCDKSGASSKKAHLKESNSKPKFDLEAELGIERSASSSSHKSQSKSVDAIDTITVKSKVPKYSTSLTNPSALGFIRLDHEGKKSKTKSRQDYKKPLTRLLSSHSNSNKVKHTDTVAFKSDSSTSNGTSTSSSSSSESGSNSDSESSDSESDVVYLGSTSTVPEIRPSRTPPILDLNWNVNSDDRKTIQLVEKRKHQVDDSSWKIDDADKNLKKGPGVSRYYAKKEIRCYNCDKEGHLSRDCPEPKKRPNCGLCGNPGHTMNRCPNQLCYNCSLPGHKGFSCPSPKRDRFAKCARCLTRGHSEEQCPDLWRQYHLTVTSGEVVQKKKAKNPRIYCCNCAKGGHFAFECRRDRPDRLVFPTYPFIVRYDKTTSANRGKTEGQSQGSSSHKKWSSKSGLAQAPNHSWFKSSQAGSAHTPHRSRSDQALSSHSSQSSQLSSRSRPQRYYESSSSGQFTQRQQSQGSRPLDKKSAGTGLDNALPYKRSWAGHPAPGTTTHSTSNQTLYPRGSQRLPEREPIPDSPHSNEAVLGQLSQESSKSHQSPHRQPGELLPHSSYNNTGGNTTGVSEAPPLSRFAQKFMGRRVQAEQSAAQHGVGKKGGIQQGRASHSSGCDQDGSQWSEANSHKRQRPLRQSQPSQEGGRDGLLESPSPAKIKKRNRHRGPKKGKGNHWNKGPPDSHPATQAAKSKGQHNTEEGQSKRHIGKRHGNRPGQKSHHIWPTASAHGTLGQGTETKVVTSNAGFRTTVRTMTVNRSYRDAQH